MTRLPRNTRHVHIRQDPHDLPYIAMTYGDREILWFWIRPRNGVVSLRVRDPYNTYKWLGTISMRDLGRIMRGADRSVELLERAVSIARGRVAEILAAGAERIVSELYPTWRGVQLRLFFDPKFPGAYLRIGGDLANTVTDAVAGILQESSIALFLHGFLHRYMMSGDGEALLAQLEEDLAEIFGAKDFRRKRATIGGLVEISSRVEIWREETLYKPVETGEGESP